MALSRVAKGQSLVEVLVAIAVVVVVLIALVAAVLVAVRGVRFSKEKVRANALAQEGLEWARNQRDSLGWADFGEQAASGGQRYCLQNLNLDQLGGCGESQLIDNIFTREAVLTLVGSDEVKITVSVAWDDGANQFASEVDTSLRQWEAE
jgi:Tfp pilus assembly protein PilV